MPRKRVHREWFRPVTPTTCHCGAKKTEVTSWGEYHNAKWRTVAWVCKDCWPRHESRLVTHLRSCGCSFELMNAPAWLAESVNLAISSFYSSKKAGSK